MTALRQEDDAPRGFVTMREYLRLRDRCEELECLLADRREDEVVDATSDLIALVRLATKVSPQGARLLIHMARMRRQVAQQEALQAVIGVDNGTHINVVVCKLNQAAMKNGAPRLVRAFHPGPNGGGRFITPEGRAWLEERVPELFAKGGTP